MSGDRSPHPDWWARLTGDRDRLGWWLLPLFLMVGLGGAVLAGSLAVVYYAQQVSQLEEETRTAREDLVGAADEVRDAADEALAAIDEELSAAREEFSEDLPLADALQRGVVRLEVDAELETAASTDATVGPAAVDDAEDADDGAADDADEDDDGDDGEEGDGDGDSEDPGDDADDGQPADPPPAPTERIALRRSGSGFVVVVDGSTAFVATSLRLLDDPRTDDRRPADVEVRVRLPAGTTTATIHSWDEANDLLLLRAEIGNVEPLPWRDEDEPLSPGDRLVAIGATPDLEVVRVAAEVAGISPRAVVTSLPALRLLAGGPVVDQRGDVIGISTADHAALGGDPVVVPVRRLCDELLSTCPD